MSWSAKRYTKSVSTSIFHDVADSYLYDAQEIEHGVIGKKCKFRTYEDELEPLYTQEQSSASHMYALTNLYGWEFLLDSYEMELIDFHQEIWESIKDFHMIYDSSQNYHFIEWLILSGEANKNLPYYNKVINQPSWCTDKAWQVYQDNKLHKGAKIILDIKDKLVKKYSPKEYFYVCMARDAVPLYVALFESGYDCLLGVFSRSQINDSVSINILKRDIHIAKEKTGKKPVLVDVQGRGTIYEHLQEEGINEEMIFGVSSNLEGCRYPVLIRDESLGKKAIKYVEKLPQSNGRAEGFYDIEHLNGVENIVIWGTRDPNYKGAELDLSDHDILCVRGVFYQCMGISPVHAGMIGTHYAQRMWGIFKKHACFPHKVGINFDKENLSSIMSKGFLTQFETGSSNGCLNTSYRQDWEENIFGKTGIRPVYGNLVSTFNENLYGNMSAIIDVNKLYPYLSYSNRDSLGMDSTFLDYINNWENDVLKSYDNYIEIQYHTIMVWDDVVVSYS